MTSIDRLLGARLRARRVVLQASEKDVAIAIGVDVETLHLYEEGLRRVSADHLFLSCQTLALKPVDLFRGLR